MLGFHIGKNKRSMPEAICNDIKQICDYDMKPCAQIFVTGPRNNHENLTTNDKRALRAICAKFPVVIHGAYVDNPWNKSVGAVPNIKKEIEIAADIGAIGVIVHLGGGANCDETLSEVLTEIDSMNKNVRGDVILYLEINTAKKSANTFETPEKINALFMRVAALGLSINIGLCIDTAHVFSCGEALYEYNFTMEWLNSLTGIHDVIFHLNDSKSSLGSGVDKHQGLTYGNIWSDYNAKNGIHHIRDSGLMAVLEWAENNNCLVILERSDEYLSADIELIHSLGFFKN
jgi:endonuclease IV